MSAVTEEKWAAYNKGVSQALPEDMLPALNLPLEQEKDIKCESWGLTKASKREAIFKSLEEWHTRITKICYTSAETHLLRQKSPSTREGKPGRAPQSHKNRPSKEEADLRRAYRGISRFFYIVQRLSIYCVTTFHGTRATQDRESVQALHISTTEIPLPHNPASPPPPRPSPQAKTSGRNGAPPSFLPTTR
jgi:hypothetical protein